MSGIKQFHFYFFILIGALIPLACDSQPTDGSGSATKSSSSSGSTTDKDGWLTVLNDAYAQSVKDQKPILAYFTASDTCRSCAQLEKEIFSAPVFSTWSKQKVVLFKIDMASQTPRGSNDQNEAMARSLNVSTFPTLWILSVTHETENGRFKVKPIGYTGYHATPEKLIGALQNFVRR